MSRPRVRSLRSRIHCGETGAKIPFLDCSARRSCCRGRKGKADPDTSGRFGRWMPCTHALVEQDEALSYNNVIIRESWPE